ncbi:MAG: hypothetical protein Q9187_000554, partial [Circinaria calcarea]
MTPPRSPQDTELLKFAEAEGATLKLCNWVHSVTLDSVPSEVQIRAKYLILDGLTGAIVGAHLPWSEIAAEAVLGMEGAGSCNVIGWEKKIGPLAAALLNSTFIQGFEIDDYHSVAPLHSNAILLPALFAAAEHVANPTSIIPLNGSSLLLATIVGYEVGPRIGLALHGADMLSMGWHSGAVFGPAASAAAVSKLLKLPVKSIEDAIGIASTQACGLMSAQFGSMVKRMQHGFAARNGLFAALMARGGYTGIEQVLERPYGGFLKTFSQGSGRKPSYLEDEVTKKLGETWQIHDIRVKPYAAMAATHSAIDCVVALQRDYPQQMEDLDGITRVEIEMSEPAYKHGGFEAIRPFTSTTAQMNAGYVVVLQILERQVQPRQFRQSQLDRDVVWNLLGRTVCKHNPELDKEPWTQRITIDFEGKPSLT